MAIRFSSLSNQMKPISFFNPITQNLAHESVILSKKITLEADNAENGVENSQQNNNTENTGGSLDEALNEVREERNDAGEGEPSGNTGGAEPGGTSDTDPGSQDVSEGDGTDSSQSSSDDSSGDGEQKLPVTGSVNRKLSLYTECNRILSVLKTSVDSLEDANSENTEIKSCVAQLQKIYEDGKLIVSKFEDYSDADIMIHLELLKERSSLVIKKLERLNSKPQS